MVMAGTSGSEDLMKFAANLTIDKDELEEFSQDSPTESKVPVNASTQDTQTRKNLEFAADRNNIDMMTVFGAKLSEGKPGH